jgi:probable O-glycosylation ligase (exosortase A-associated)
MEPMHPWWRHVRDFALVVLLCASLPVCFFQPYFGVLMWVWIAYFNPHRFTFSYMYDFPIAAAVAVPTMAGLLLNRKFNRPLLVRENLLLMALWAWFCIVYVNALHEPLFAGHMADAKYELLRISKILLMTFVIMLVTNSEKRLKWLFLVTSFSFGALAVKGALFGLATSGQFRVFGPPDTFISENNAFGLALNMSLPFFFFLSRVEKNTLLRRALNVGFICALICILLTYSRGGLLGLAAVLSFLAWRSKYRALGAALLVTCTLVIVSFAPPQWMQRMETLRQEGVDMSAQQRLVSWGTTWNFAHDFPLMGGSFYTLPDVAIFQKYQTRPLPGGHLSSGPHSIYFQVLGEQGFIGFAIYFGLVGCCLVTLRRLRRRTVTIPELQWISVYADIMTGSILGFLVSGAFLGFADFDLYYQIVASVCILKVLFYRQAAAYGAVRVPAPAVLQPGEEFA